MVSQNTSAASPISVDLFSMATMTEMSVHAMALSDANAVKEEARTPMHCKYPSKKCWNTRVEKRNGELHKFCEYHRQKANSNQRRMEQRRKQQQRTVPTIVEQLQINTNPNSIINTDIMHNPKRFMVSSPCGVDHTGIEFQAIDMKRDMCMDVPFTPCDTVEFDVGYDAAIECMMLDTDIDMEPSDLPVDLYEADLYFLEHFMSEITQGVF